MAAQKWTLVFREERSGDVVLTKARPPKTRRFVEGSAIPAYVRAQAPYYGGRASVLMGYSGDNVQHIDAMIEEEHMANAKVSDKINMDGIAELFGLDTYEHLHEQNIDYFGDAGYEARKYALSEGASEEEADEADMKAQEEADTEMFHQWHSAVMAAAESLFEKHGLTLEPRPVNKTDRYPYEYKVVPEESWEKALVPIIETVNGVGMFHFSGVKEFLRSGPYTPREGVLTHMHWIKDYPAVYGDTSAQRIYERSFR